jgi:hypothetical protein
MRDRRSPLLHPSSAVGGGAGAGDDQDAQRSSERGTSHSHTTAAAPVSEREALRRPLLPFASPDRVNLIVSFSLTLSAARAGIIADGCFNYIVSALIDSRRNEGCGF